MIGLACFALSLALPTNDPFAKWGEGDTPVLVAAFVSVDCPVAQFYAARLNEIARDYEPKGVTVVGVVPNPSDSAEAIRAFKRQGNLTYSVIHDADQALAERFAITRTPEVVVLNRARTILYRGRVDDQYVPGLRRAQPTRHDLQLALDEILAGKVVGVPKTDAAGCPVERIVEPASARATYHRDVAPILDRRCVSCHQPGGIGPFSLLTAANAVRRARAIREAVAERRMPPWYADPKYGHFANDPSLTESERQIIEEWAKAGAPVGDPHHGSALVPMKSDGWRIREPQVVISIPKPFAVPASGTVEYEIIEVDPGFSEDVWVQEAEIRPSNRKVVHHATVFLRPPGVSGGGVQGELGSVCLCAYAMGTPPTVFPDGMAKRIPAGWRMVFIIHYVATGTPQSDQTAIGLRIVDRKQVRKEVATNLFLADSFTIAPHQADFVISQSRTFDKDVLLLSLFPHMHLRGVTFKFEVAYPDGRTETLLSLPKWDIEWQHRYVFAKPKFLPAGSVLTATARYDNSAANPNNPDPNATVNVGPQTEDEMFNGYYDFCLADQDLTKTTWAQLLAHPAVWWIVLAGLSALILMMKFRNFLSRN